MRSLDQKLTKHIDLLMHRYPNLESIREDIIEGYLMMQECYENGGKLLVAGNGGSAADSEQQHGILREWEGPAVWK